VVSAALDKGILTIDLHRPTTLAEVRTIAIQTVDDDAGAKIATR
jgi:hypothetical protein